MMEDKLAGIKSDFLVSEILNALKKNQELHVDNYLTAYKEYRAQLQLTAGGILELIRNGKSPEVAHNFGLIVPQNKSDQYFEIIYLFEQAEKSGNREISLSFGEADAIFNDNWDWLRSAKAINSTYNATASSAGSYF